MYGSFFPRLNLEYKIGERTSSIHGSIYVYPSVHNWAEYRRYHSVLLCKTNKLNEQVVKAFNIYEVEDVVFDKQKRTPAIIADAALCDYVIPIKELSHSELKTLFTIHEANYMLSWFYRSNQ